MSEHRWNDPYSGVSYAVEMEPCTGIVGYLSQETGESAVMREMIRLSSALAASQAEAERLREALANPARTYWVIELAYRNPTTYLCIRDAPSADDRNYVGHAVDIADALRFDRQVDAQRYIDMYAGLQCEHLVAREHMDVPRAALQEGTKEES